MAIVRWGSMETHGYESDLYIYEAGDATESWGYVCCGCPFGQSYGGVTRDEMANHVQQHIDAGHTVPDWVIPTLRNEIEEKPDPVIAEMIALAHRAQMSCGCGYGTGCRAQDTELP